jgi:hypothetical protein
MKPTKQDAEAMLRNAGETQAAVRARTPQQYVLNFTTYLMLVLVGLDGDLNDGGGVVPEVVHTLALVAVAVLVAVLVPYLRRSRQVRMGWDWPLTWPSTALAAWILAAFFGIPLLLEGTIGFPHTLGAILAVVPPLLWDLWALRFRRTA